MNHPENHSNKSGKDNRLVKEDYVTVPERPCKGVELIEDAAQEHFREEGFFYQGKTLVIGSGRELNCFFSMIR